ncbi:MAG: hypothetical protein ABEJ03_06280 [Candidatus Nanohaloarchaea archaeon]
MSDEDESPPEKDFGWMELGKFRRGDIDGFVEFKVSDAPIKEQFPHFYKERNRDQIFILLDRALNQIEELFPNEDNAEETYKEQEKRIRVEQIALFCQAAEDLGGIIYSIENSEDIDEFADNLQNYGVGDVKDTYRDLLDNELDEAREFIKEILNLPEGDIDEELEEDVEFSIEHFFSITNSIAENFLTFHKFYNAYKHGYRIIWGDTRTTWKTGNIEIEEETEVSEETTYVYLTRNETRAFTLTDDKLDELRTRTSDCDKFIKLLRDNFKWKEENWVRRIKKAEETDSSEGSSS